MLIITHLYKVSTGPPRGGNAQGPGDLQGPETVREMLNTWNSPTIYYHKVVE